MIENYMAQAVLECMALLILLMQVMSCDLLSQRKRNFFSAVVIVSIVIIAAEACAVLCDNQRGALRVPSVLANMVGFAATPFIPLLLMVVFSHKLQKIYWWMLLPAVGNAALCVASVWTGSVFYVSPDNFYVRGPLFAVFVVSYVWGSAVAIFCTARVIAHYRQGPRAFFAILVAFLLIGTSIQVLFPFLHISWACVTMALLLYYGFLCALSNKLDILTELFSRRTYENAVRDLEGRQRVCIVVLDVDGFKKVNDNRGHQYGDRCLRMVAGMLRESFAGVGECYRIGGDEFCVLCPRTEAEEVQKRLTKLTEGLLEKRKTEPRLPTLSCGVSLYRPEGPLSFSEAFREADHQMYLQKEKVHQTEKTLF